MNDMTNNRDDTVVEVYTLFLCNEILEPIKEVDFYQSHEIRHDAMVNMKYKMVAKKVKLVET